MTTWAAVMVVKFCPYMDIGITAAVWLRGGQQDSRCLVDDCQYAKPVIDWGAWAADMPAQKSYESSLPELMIQVATTISRRLVVGASSGWAYATVNFEDPPAPTMSYT